MTSYIYLVYKAGLQLMAGYNHSQEYLGQNLGLGPLVRQAFARCTLYVTSWVRRNALCTIKNLKRFLNSNTQLT